MVAFAAPAVTLAQATTTPAPAPATADNPLAVQARSALLMDVRTGEVLYSFNDRDPMQPASLTKIMAFEIYLESLAAKTVSLDDKATVSEKAWRLSLNNRLSNMFIDAGERVPVRDLLYGLMVSSGNDVSVVLAEHRSGSEEAFVLDMNERARALGLTDTRFANSHGLFAPDQASTARDMALLTRRILLQHPGATEYTSRPSFTWNGITQPNWNELIGKDTGINVPRDPRVTGFKTGHLNEAGYHLVATARDKEKDLDLIAVVMGTDARETRAREALKLLTYGFNNFRTVTVDWKKRTTSELPVYKGKERRVALVTDRPVVTTVRRGTEDSLKVTADLPPEVIAPVRKGQRLGTLTLSSGERELARYELLAAEGVSRGGLSRVVWDSLRLFFRGLFKTRQG